MTTPQATLAGFALVAAAILGAARLLPGARWEIASYPEPGSIGAIARLNVQTGAIDVCPINVNVLAYDFGASMTTEKRKQQTHDDIRDSAEKLTRTHCYLVGN